MKSDGKSRLIFVTLFKAAKNKMQNLQDSNRPHTERPAPKQERL